MLNEVNYQGVANRIGRPKDLNKDTFHSSWHENLPPIHYTTPIPS